MLKALSLSVNSLGVESLSLHIILKTCVQSFISIISVNFTNGRSPSSMSVDVRPPTVESTCLTKIVRFALIACELRGSN